MKLSIKLAVLVLPIALMSTTLQAAPNYFEGFSLEDCLKIELVAKKIMEDRQGGKPMSEFIVAIGAGEGRVETISKAMVIDAYEEPIWSFMDTLKQQAVDEFSEDWFKACYL